MANNAKQGKNLAKLKKMAKAYGVDKNAMVCAAIEQYAFQLDVIMRIKYEIESSDGLLTDKEYVKGRENVYANPLVKELPKHSDAANKTAQTLKDLIEKFGTAPRVESKLDKLRDA